MELSPYAGSFSESSLLLGLDVRLELSDGRLRPLPLTAVFASRGAGKNIVACGRLDDVQVEDVRAAVVEFAGESRRIEFA